MRLFKDTIFRSKKKTPIAKVNIESKKVLSFREKKIIVMKRKFNSYLHPAMCELIREIKDDHWNQCHEPKAPWDDNLPQYRIHDLDNGRYEYWSAGTWDDWSYSIDLITDILSVHKGTWDCHWTEHYRFDKKTKKYILIPKKKEDPWKRGRFYM